MSKVFEYLAAIQYRSKQVDVQGSQLSQDEWLLLHDVGKPGFWRSAAYCTECQTILNLCQHNPIPKLVPQPEDWPSFPANYNGPGRWRGSALYWQRLQDLVNKVKAPKVPQQAEKAVTAPSTSKKRLTVEEVPANLRTQIEAAYLKDQTIRQIADEHFIEPAAVSTILKAAGIEVTRFRKAKEKPKLTDAQKAQIVKLFKKLTVKAISEKLDVTSSLVSEALKEAGVSVDKAASIAKAKALKPKLGSMYAKYRK